MVTSEIIEILSLSINQSINKRIHDVPVMIDWLLQKSASRIILNVKVTQTPTADTLGCLFMTILYIERWWLLLKFWKIWHSNIWMFLLLYIKLAPEQQEAVKMVFYIYLNFEQSILKGLLKYPIHFYGMGCRNLSETVTRLALLNRHIYNIITPRSKSHVYLLLWSVYLLCI
jgi:hypothetical protein